MGGVSDKLQATSNRAGTWPAVWLVAAWVGLAWYAGASAADAPSSTQPAPAARTPSSADLFHDPDDGAFDVSEFLSTRQGFLPVAVPITEPAVGYGLALGLTFFHDRPRAVPGAGGAPPRVVMPSTTVLFGAGTENGTWSAGVGHLGMWDDGRVRYLGAAGYASLNLDWFGKGDALQGNGISYTNDVLFVVQRLNLQLGDSNLFAGPQYRFFASDAAFDLDGRDSGIPTPELQSQTSGLGFSVGYDSLDHPYSPTRGLRADVTYSQQAAWLGGDFDYGRLDAYAIAYLPVSDRVVLGLKGSGSFNFGSAPFYDLPAIIMRGIPRGRYVDNNAAYAAAELRYDVTARWTLVTFGGVGWVGESAGDLLDAGDAHSAVGAGFRYLIARQYGLRMGLDVAYGDDGDWTFYVAVGTGWVRP